MLCHFAWPWLGKMQGIAGQIFQIKGNAGQCRGHVHVQSGAFHWWVPCLPHNHQPSWLPISIWLEEIQGIYRLNQPTNQPTNEPTCSPPTPLFPTPRTLNQYMQKKVREIQNMDKQIENWYDWATKALQMIWSHDYWKEEEVEPSWWIFPMKNMYENAIKSAGNTW